MAAAADAPTTPPGSGAPPAEETTPLRRAIGPGLLLLFVVGDMLGAGIYALVGEVGAETGGAVWLGFAVALLLAVFTAFAYAELVTKYPRAAGAALYANKAFRVPFFTFIVAFAVMASGITSAATLARGFTESYLSAFVDAPIVPIAIAFLALTAVINFIGISESVKVNVVFTLIEIAGLVLICVVAIGVLGDGGGDAGRAFEVKEGSTWFAAAFAGAALAFYALIGFEDSVNVVEEVQEPRRTFPKALFGGLAIAGTIYLVVTVLASMAVPTNTLTESESALREVIQRGPLGIDERVLSAIALVALANGALINLIMASRLVYGMSREGILPRAFGRVHAGRRTPWIAILLVTAFAMVLAATGDLKDLASTTVTLLLCVFIVVNVAVFVLRRREVDAEPDHFRAPSIFPVLGIAVSIFLLTKQEADTFTRALLVLLVGVVLYLVNRLIAGPPRPPMDTAQLEVVSHPPR